ncbi:MAG TPA: AAA family ATPase [Candidatus Saccharimonadales bacterium]|jgi:predicted ABC-type ATPase
MHQPKLIILRGPSGSGKSTISKILFENAQKKAALIEQDHYRFIFKPAGGGGKANSATIHKMIKSDTIIALADGYDVILEGILGVTSYDKVLEDIFAAHPDNNFLYYFDISFEETVKRHATRTITQGSGFTEEDMREWYPASRISDTFTEQIISETSSIDDTVATILSDSGL